MLCLTTSTDPTWADRALNDLPTLLSDHAHCEMKAASNALSLAGRLPHSIHIARTLIALAQEELQHFDAMLVELDRRGIALPPPAVDTYAAELRRAMRKDGEPTQKAAFVDRLLVAALIEARSCERLGLLTAALKTRGEEQLAKLYEELFASEARHYRTFVDLAVGLLGDEAQARSRLAEIATFEGEIAVRLGSGTTMHG